MMELLANQTNLKHFKNLQTPRIDDIVYGRATKAFYQKLKFVSTEIEDQFEKLFVNFILFFVIKISMGARKDNWNSNLLFDTSFISKIRCSSVVFAFSNGLN